MALEKPMYNPIAFSPVATLTSDIAVGSTVIPVSNVNAFPPAPSYATIGTDENAETIRYTAKTADSLSGCVRGVEGVAQAWQTGESIARNFTAEDHQALIDNLLALAAELQQAYSPTNKPTATDVGAFVSYKNYGSGFFQNHDTRTWCTGGSYLTEPNDTNLPYQAADSKYGTMFVVQGFNDTRYIQIWTRWNVDDAYWIRRVNRANEADTWKQLFTTAGGTLNGNLSIQGGKGGFRADANGVIMDSVETDNNYRSLWVRSKTSSPNISTATAFFDSSTSTLFSLFGEHNKSLLTESAKNLQFRSGYRENNYASYYKDADGIVHIEGSIIGTIDTTGRIVADMPVGYRPGGNVYGNIAAYNSSSNGLFEVNASGEVSQRLYSGSSDYAYISIHYKAVN